MSEKKNKIIVTIEGPIGAGKTTLGYEIQNQNYSFYAENAHKDCLQLYINDPKEHGGNLQLWMLSDTMCRLALAQQDPYKICFIDRSEWGNQVFAKVNYDLKNISESGMEFYNSVCTKNLSDDIDLVLFVYETPETCMERTNKRNLKDEDKYKMEYFEMLDEAFFQSLIHTDIKFFVVFATIFKIEVNMLRMLIKTMDGFPSIKFAKDSEKPDSRDHIMSSRNDLLSERPKPLLDVKNIWINYKLKKENNQEFKQCVYILLTFFHHIIFYNMNKD